MKVFNQRIQALGLFIWLIAAVFFLYEFFLRTFVGSIAQQLIKNLHLTVEQFTLIGSAYYIAYGLMQIPVGIIADKYGLKKAMVFATLTCGLATLFFAQAHSFPLALVARFLMGLGSSFAFVCLLVIASEWFPVRYFGFFAGVSQFVGTLGPFLAGGPFIAWLARHDMHWRSALMFAGLFGVVLMIFVLCFVKNRQSAEASLAEPLSAQESLALRLKNLLTTKQAWAIALYSGAVYVPIAVMAAVWGTDYLQSVGLTQKDAAYMISAAWLAYAVGCPALGLLSDIARRRKPFLIACALLGLFSLVLVLFARPHSYVAYLVIFSMLGLAVSGQNIGFAAITESCGANAKACAIGLNNSMITVFTLVLPLLIGLVMTVVEGSGNAQHLSSHTFVAGLSLLLVAALFSLIVSMFFCKETYCRPYVSAK